MGVAGLLIGIMGWRDARRSSKALRAVEERRRAQLCAMLQDAERAAGDHEIIRAIIDRHPQDTSLAYWLATTHQAGCDLYKSLVTRYLEEEESFTWTDLTRVAAAGGLSWVWQEEYWRTLLLRRPENVSKPPPVGLVKERSGRLARAEQVRNPGLT